MENNKETAEEFYQKALSHYQQEYIYEALDLVNTALYYYPDFIEAVELKEKLKDIISNSNSPIIYRRETPRKLSKNEPRKALLYSVVTVGATLIIISLSLNPDIPFQFSTRIFATITSSTFLILGIVSFIIYLINPEIAYGMWIGRRRQKTINNRNVTIGRRILVIILLTGLTISSVAFVSIISTILP